MSLFINFMRNNTKNIARALIGFVLFINLQCALLFLWKPSAYSSGFEATGLTGDFFIRSLGILFIMWNIPYLVAFLEPKKHRISLFEAITMQSIGLAGETLLLLSLPPDHISMHNSLTRFILFDSIGLSALILSAIITRS